MIFWQMGRKQVGPFLNAEVEQDGVHRAFGHGDRDDRFLRRGQTDQRFALVLPFILDSALIAQGLDDMIDGRAR